jgi:hypothetical protein
MYLLTQREERLSERIGRWLSYPVIVSLGGRRGGGEEGSRKQLRKLVLEERVLSLLELFKCLQF